MDDIVIGRQDGRPQRRRVRTNAFGPRKRQAFLDALAFSCNVRASAAHAGVDISTVYYNRSRDRHFAEQWREAIEVGYDRLEALVLEHGGAGQALSPPDPERAEAHAEGGLPPFDFAKAMAILAQYRRKRSGEPVRTGGRKPGYATRAQTNAALAAALGAVRRRIEREGKPDG